jgi:hypothetical protein
MRDDSLKKKKRVKIVKIETMEKHEKNIEIIYFRFN